MKILSLFILSFCLTALAQEQIRQDKVQIGKPSTASDKELVFDTNDGASNPKLSVEKTTKKLKFNKNDIQIGDATATTVKTINFNGANKNLKYDGTANELQHDGDKLSLGDGTNTNKVLKFNKGANSPEIRYNSTSSKLEFSNDATTYKVIGSGGGGGETGVNLLTDPSFEDGVANLSNSGGTLTSQSYTASVEGDLKYARFVSSAGAQYVQTGLLTTPDNLGAGGMADLMYATTATTWKWQALTSTGTVIAEVTLPATESATAFKKLSPMVYVSPLPGEQLRGRLLAGEASTINFDKMYVGGNKNLSYSQTAQMAGSSYFPFNASCTWQRSTTTMGQFTTVAACNGPTIVDSSLGTWLTTDSDLPRQSIQNLPAGKYQVIATINAGPTGVAGANAYTISDGTTTCQGTASNVSALNQSSAITISCMFSYSTTGDRYFEIYSQPVTSSTSNLYNSDARYQTSFVITRFPQSSEVAITPEQAEWNIDVNIGGANITGANVSSYTELTNASLDMVINSGSASAKIPCSSTNPATGLTCSAGNESLGVHFTNKLTGLHEVCADFGAYGNSTATMTFQLVETTPSTQTIIQEGKGRAGAIIPTSATQPASPFRVCGTFNFSSISERTIRLMYEATSTTVGVLADRSATDGQRDIHITVRALQNPQSRPILLAKQKQELVLHQTNGYGSSGTTTRRWSTIVKNSLGTAATFTQDATNGDYITINEEDLYCTDLSDNFSSANNFGVTINTSSSQSFATTMTTASNVVMAQGNGSTTPGLASGCSWLSVGDVIRAQSQGTAADTATRARWKFQRMNAKN